MPIRFGRFSPVNQLFYALCCVGVFFPSSIGGHIYGLLFMAACGVSAALLVLLAGQCRMDMQILIWISIPVPLLLTIFTVIAIMRGIHEANINIEGFLPFSVCAFAYCIKMRKCVLLKSLQVLTWWSILNCFVGSSMLFGIKIVDDFFTSYYNAFAPDIVPLMLLARAPVLTYATHSLAAFFLYTFFWINLSAYKKTERQRYMFFSIAHLVLCICLMSHTSFALSIAAIVELFCFTFRRHPKSTIATMVMLVYLISYELSGFIGVSSWKEAASMAISFWQSGGNGMSRFGSEGNQTIQLAYLKQNWTPIGMMQSDLINPDIADCAPLDYVLRGSFPLLLMMYGGLWLFLHRNLANPSDRYHLFFSILATEIGIEVLPYSRSLCLLPGIVLLLIGLDKVQKPTKHDKRSCFAKIVWLPRHCFTELFTRIQRAI
jgi:hypothetical protein